MIAVRGAQPTTEAEGLYAHTDGPLTGPRHARFARGVPEVVHSR